VSIAAAACGVAVMSRPAWFQAAGSTSGVLRRRAGRP
jgi:hypothetical protein